MAYEYCLTCDSAMSRRFVYAGGTTSTQGEVLQGQRFVYDGLTLLRVDQLYDSDEDEALEMTDGWRVWWENTTMPALLGGLLAKRVYSYPNHQSGASNGSTDFYYAHDSIGNVIAVSDSAGARQHHFTQDAFGNRLALASLGGDNWDDAHEDGIWEHQTGKWFDPETELYFFHARWVDPVVGRFVSATLLPRHEEQRYEFCENNPILRLDANGLKSMIPIIGPVWDWIKDWWFPDDNVSCKLRSRVCRSGLPPLNPGSPDLGDVVDDFSDSCFDHGVLLMAVPPNVTAAKWLHGKQKRSRSYSSELEDFTFSVLQAMCKTGNRKACQMVKLMKERGRLGEKGNLD